jgi:glycosyltransferase involved in cell wall biosynthesis
MIDAPRPLGLSIFFPAYNDAGTIGSLVIRALQVAEQLTPDYEVVVVNDGSTDATRTIVDELERTYAHVRAVHHERYKEGEILLSAFREEDVIAGRLVSPDAYLKRLINRSGGLREPRS